MNTTTRRAAIYARLSVTTEESVSIDRQIEAATKYAEARGFEVALIATDDGVSATKTRPETRDGWQQILAAAPSVDVVIVWKVDRLCRRVLDFLRADEALQAAGAGLVAVEDPIDMTTPQGRAFAVMLSVFAELEAASTSSRVKAAREHLTRNGRHSAGDLAWPLQAVPTATGAGFVARPIPERAEAVRDAAAWLLDGVSLSEVARRWTAAGLPTAGKGRSDRNAPLASWSRTSVKGIMTNPVLFGATVHRGSLLRAEDGTVKIDEERVILDRPTWTKVQEALSSAPRGRRPVCLPLLHNIARCASCNAPLSAHRPSDEKRPATYRCQNRECSARVTVGMTLLNEYVVSAYLAEKGSASVFDVVTVEEAASPEEADRIEAELLDVQEALDATDDDETALSLIRRRKALRAELDALSTARTESVVRRLDIGTVGELLDAAASDEERRRVVSEYLGSVTVGKGTRGRHGLDSERVALDWK